jgi:hypothetical protein
MPDLSCWTPRWRFQLSLVDHKVAAVVRLARARPGGRSGGTSFLETMEKKASRRRTRWSLASARWVSGSRRERWRGCTFLAGPSSSLEVNLVVAEALIGLRRRLGPSNPLWPSAVVLAGGLAVAHYFAAGNRASRPASTILNEAQLTSNWREVASLTARFSTAEIPALVQAPPDPEVGKRWLRGSARLGPFAGLVVLHREKRQTDVSTSHLRVASDYLMTRSNPVLDASSKQACCGSGSRPRGAVSRDRVLNVPQGWPDRCAPGRQLVPIEPGLVNAGLAILREAEPSEAWRAAIRVTAEIGIREGGSSARSVARATNCGWRQPEVRERSKSRRRRSRWLWSIRAESTP